MTTTATKLIEVWEREAGRPIPWKTAVGIVAAVENLAHDAAQYLLVTGESKPAPEQQPAAPAPVPAPDPRDAAEQATLARIATAKAEELPPIVTMPITDWSTGTTELRNARGEPLTAIEKAVIKRAEQLRNGAP